MPVTGVQTCALPIWVKMVFFLSCADIFAGPPFKNGGIEEHIELFDSYAEYAGEEEVAEFMDYHQNRES